MQLRGLAAGKPVFRQGDRPDAFYVVRKGVLEVVEEDPETRRGAQVLRDLGRGESFGELGLVDRGAAGRDGPRRRDAELFEVDKGAFDRLLADKIHVPGLRADAASRSPSSGRPQLLRQPVDRRSSAELLERGEWVNFAPGEDDHRARATWAIRSTRYRPARSTSSRTRGW